MPATAALRIVAIVLGMVALILVGVSALADPAAPRLVLALVGISAVITVAVILGTGWLGKRRG